MLEVIIGGLIGIFGSFMGIYYQSRVENKRIEATRKKEEEREKKEDEKERERRKIEDEKERERRKIEEDNNRRELLVSFIRDENEKIEVRKEAAREYLSKNYNGLIKRYIYENGLNIETKKE